MKQKCLALMAAMLCGGFATSVTIEKLFREMPFALCPVLNGQQRMELLEYTKAGMADSIRNEFGAWSHLSEVDVKRGYIRCSFAKGAEMELLIVSPPSEEAACRVGVIETVCAPVCSSIISLYDTAWNKLPLQLPDFEPLDFIDAEACRNDSVPIEELIDLLPPYFIRARFADDSATVVFTNETIRQLSAPDQDRYEKYLREKRVKLF